jgi:hypothetical protein
VHTVWCDSDKCALNGDYWSCTGRWETCEVCGGEGEVDTGDDDQRPRRGAPPVTGADRPGARG